MISVIDDFDAFDDFDDFDVFDVFDVFNEHSVTGEEDSVFSDDVSRR